MEPRSRAEWNRELPWNKKDKHDEVTQEDPDEYPFGFDNQVKLGWRVKSDDPDGIKEWSLPVTVPAGGAPTDPITVTYPDGTEQTVHEFTLSQLAGLEVGRKAEPPLWQGSHKTTHHKLVIDQRVDRLLLLSLYEQGKQVLQVGVKKFGEVPTGPPTRLAPTHPAVTRALKFIIPIAESYMEGAIEPEDLKIKRDELMQAMQGSASNKKRKAADMANPKKEAPVAPHEAKNTEEEPVAPHEAKNKEAKPVAAHAAKNKAEKTADPKAKAAPKQEPGKKDDSEWWAPCVSSGPPLPHDEALLAELGQLCNAQD